MRHSHQMSVTLQFTGLIVSALLLSGCANGPSDFMNFERPQVPDAAPAHRQLMRTEAEKIELEQSLLATAHRQGGVTPSATSALALTIIRQQQMEEARELLKASSGLAPACGGADQPACPQP
jgi:hypothetical protein